MNFKFNTAQLSRSQLKNLMGVLGVIQSENKNEIEIWPVEFPIKLKVMLDDNIAMLLGWNPETDSYSGISMPKDWEPETKPESQKDTTDLPKPEPKPEPKTVTEPEPEPKIEPDLSPVVVRVHALARAFVGLLKPLNPNQRLEMWIEYIRSFWNEMS